MVAYRDLIARTEQLVNSPDVVDLIPNLLNDGLYQIAGGMLSDVCQTIVPPLPLLYKRTAVTLLANQSNVPMPDDFMRSLHFVVDADALEIDIANNLNTFFEDYVDLKRVGRIQEVVEHGNVLYYAYVPDVDTEVTLQYYRKPILMDGRLSQPDGIPEHLQIPLLTNFAAWKAFEFIESGLEGESPNVLKYKAFFTEALHTLELSIPDYTRGFELP